jgi:hypothetical protein
LAEITGNRKFIESILYYFGCANRLGLDSPASHAQAACTRKGNRIQGSGPLFFQASFSLVYYEIVIDRSGLIEDSISSIP